MPKPTRRKRKQGSNKPRPGAEPGVEATGPKLARGSSREDASSRVQVPSRPAGAPKVKKAVTSETAEPRAVKAQDRVSERPPADDSRPQVLPAPKNRLPLYLLGTAVAGLFIYWLATRGPAEEPPTVTAPAVTDAGSPRQLPATGRPPATTPPAPTSAPPSSAAPEDPPVAPPPPSSTLSVRPPPPPPPTATAKITTPPPRPTAAAAAPPNKSSPPAQPAPLYGD